MLKKMQKFWKQQKGFTLVELLAVIAILGIIVAIAVPAIGNVIAGAEDDADEANIELIENAARLADVSGEFTDDEDGMTVAELHSTGYLEEIPSNPADDNQVYAGSVTKNEDGIFAYTESWEEVSTDENQ
ncbi:competence type IV pilus major pilin ComGC [Lentibacillus sediminis]|uniref:competence type IV pilus major pilin ComGC n=1 Tax=Lentibacillus sediminis TaxID=1940529 RepID=UPI000C1B84FD|nr:prepilin-type N-terminal cleavage/methylation domain-containing protein [Lentibacillus sediminis]